MALTPAPPAAQPADDQGSFAQAQSQPQSPVLCPLYPPSKPYSPTPQEQEKSSASYASTLASTSASASASASAASASASASAPVESQAARKIKPRKIKPRYPYQKNEVVALLQAIRGTSPKTVDAKTVDAKSSDVKLQPKKKRKYGECRFNREECGCPTCTAQHCNVCFMCGLGTFDIDGALPGWDNMICRGDVYDLKTHQKMDHQKDGLRIETRKPIYKTKFVFYHSISCPYQDYRADPRDSLLRRFYRMNWLSRDYVHILRICDYDDDPDDMEKDADLIAGRQRFQDNSDSESEPPPELEPDSSAKRQKTI
jgi:hypothetical protein